MCKSSLNNYVNIAHVKPIISECIIHEKISEENLKDNVDEVEKFAESILHGILGVKPPISTQVEQYLFAVLDLLLVGEHGEVEVSDEHHSRATFPLFPIGDNDNYV